MKEIKTFVWDTEEDGVVFKRGQIVTSNKKYKRKFHETFLGKIIRFIHDDHSSYLPPTEYAELVDLDGELFTVNEVWMKPLKL